MGFHFHFGFENYHLCYLHQYFYFNFATILQSERVPLVKRLLSWNQKFIYEHFDRIFIIQILLNYFYDSEHWSYYDGFAYFISFCSGIQKFPDRFLSSHLSNDGYHHLCRWCSQKFIVKFVRVIITLVYEYPCSFIIIIVIINFSSYCFDTLTHAETRFINKVFEIDLREAFWIWLLMRFIIWFKSRETLAVR